MAAGRFRACNISRRDISKISRNNIMLPKLGAANTPYARSVPPLTIQPASLPDPGVVFDCLFARNEYTPHPNNVSSVLFYWASIIIHGWFSFLE
jgi:linoleate 10R-lipoxygenase